MCIRARIQSSNKRPLINALADMYLILINAALLIDAAAFITSSAYTLIIHIVYRTCAAYNKPNRSNIKINYINLHEDETLILNIFVFNAVFFF